MKRRIIIVLGIVLAFCLFGTSSAFATTTSENLSAYLINHYDRAPRGLRALSLSQTLSTLARSHSYEMRNKRLLFHTINLGSKVTGWHYLGENVGVGPDLRKLNAAFMKSYHHRANILCRCYSRIGVGVVRDSRGYYWVTHIFFS
ncbi:MAG: CAP domain-containing protein [Actinomycetota bacterium]|nr:CAP domain-containing protein [Actinomycetota bacterium]